MAKDARTRAIKLNDLRRSSSTPFSVYLRAKRRATNIFF